MKNNSKYPYNLIFDIFKNDIYQEVQEPKDLMESLDEVLARLPKMDVWLLKMRYQEKKPVQEIVDNTGVSGQAIDRRMKEIIRKLQHPRYKQYLKYGLTALQHRKIQTEREIYSDKELISLGDSVWNISVSHLPVDERIYMALKRNGLDTLGDIRNVKRLESLNWIGKKSSRKLSALLQTIEGGTHEKLVNFT